MKACKCQRMIELNSYRVAVISLITYNFTEGIIKSEFLILTKLESTVLRGVINYSSIFFYVVVRVLCMLELFDE